MASEDSQGIFVWAIRLSFVVAVISMAIGALDVASYFTLQGKHDNAVAFREKKKVEYEQAKKDFDYLVSTNDPATADDYKSATAGYESYMLNYLRNHPHTPAATRPAAAVGAGAATRPATQTAGAARPRPSVAPYEWTDIVVTEVHSVPLLYAAGYFGTGLLLAITAFLLLQRAQWALYATIGIAAVNLIVTLINTVEALLGGGRSQLVVLGLLLVLGAAAIFTLTKSFGALEEDTIPQRPAPPSRGAPPAKKPAGKTPPTRR